MSIIIGIVISLAMFSVAPWVANGILPHAAGPRLRSATSLAVRAAALFVALLFVASTSFVIVSSDEVGLLKKIYLGSDLDKSRIIALDGEKGPQADILGPGFHFRLLLNVLYEVDKVPVVEVPEGKYGYLVASDGAPLRPGQTFADAFADNLKDRMLDADTFLKNGGQRGPQVTVLTPGRYRLNTYLWKVALADSTAIPTGQVGVVKSNAESSVNFSTLKAPAPKDCTPTVTKSATGAALPVPLVPVGCIGIWDKPILPGAYYINRAVYDVHVIDTRVQAWMYQGGFTQRIVDLTVDAEGNIQQKERAVDIPEPQESADRAIAVKIEGYTIYQQARVLVEVPAENAPYVLASVGDLEKVEDRIMTPSIQSTVRNLSGQFITVSEPLFDEKTGKYQRDADGNVVTRTVTRPILPLDFIERRDVLQTKVSSLIRDEGKKAGVEIKEVLFLEPDLPPEILIPRKRQQLAIQMVETLNQEQKAQEQRIAKERAAATANQQASLVTSQIEVQRSEQYKIERQNRGDADRDYLEALAQGQKAQALVLGEDRVMLLTLAEKILDALKEKPELVALMGKLVPNTVVTGGGSDGLAGAAAILRSAVGGNEEPPKQP
ncbi:MAG TPA: hypothetical protein VMQ73_14375 [Methylomirabilota bacterium]|nr:hypothetical protein [Methylomirabilota bacterium]